MDGSAPTTPQPPEEEAKGRHGLEQRLTKKLVQKGFCAVPSFFLKTYHRIVPHDGAAGLTSTEAMLIVHLLDYKWTKDDPFPGVEELAKRLGISTRAVRMTLARLVDLKLLEKEERTTSNGAQTSNKYKLEKLFKKLEAMIDDEDAKEEKPKGKKAKKGAANG